MKFIAAAAALAAVASAASNVTYVTEVVDVYTTYCPYATQFSHNGVTYTATEATTITVSNCPCTITRPVYSTSSVVCNSCTGAPAASSPAPVYANTTVATNTQAAATTPLGTGAVTVSTGVPSTIATAGAGKTLALSGASLAGVMGLAALLM